MKWVAPMAMTINARAEMCILYPGSWNRAKGVASCVTKAQSRETMSV